jgi:tetratricopeptide (TPR) repeat protein
MMVGSLFVIFVFVGMFGGVFTFSYFIVFSISCIPLAVLSAIFVEKVGSGAGNFLMCSFKLKESNNDVFIADLEKARHNKANGRYEEALELIEGVLLNASDWPDALYLKAQIEWEGFGNSTAAKRALTKVMQLVKHDETLHRWASSYFDLIVRADKEKFMEAHSSP